MKVTSLRQRLELHRKVEPCASCHKIMDPIGFALENFDMVGTWRELDGKTPIDASGQLVDGTKLNGVADLRNALLSRPGNVCKHGDPEAFDLRCRPHGAIL